MDSAKQSNDRYFAGVAVLAVCPLTEAKKVLVGYLAGFEPAVARVLIDRRPAWLDDWIAGKLAGQVPDMSWTLLRSLYGQASARSRNTTGIFGSWPPARWALSPKENGVSRSANSCWQRPICWKTCGGYSK